MHPLRLSLFTLLLLAVLGLSQEASASLEEDRQRVNLSVVDTTPGDYYNEITGLPGETVTFLIEVTNTGDDYIEDLGMIARAPGDYLPTLSNNNLTLEPEESEVVMYNLTIPQYAEGGYGLGCSITVRIGEGAEFLGNWQYLEVSVEQVYNISVDYYYNESYATKSVKEGMGSLEIFFNISNHGNGRDEISISLKNAPSWLELNYFTVDVSPSSTEVRRIEFRAPDEILQNQTYIFQIMGTSQNGIVTSVSKEFTINIIAPILGCMDNTAKNYNNNAEKDDGSCIYAIKGCMNSTAINYVPEAEVDNGGCKFAPLAFAGQNATGTPGVPLQFSGAGTDEDGTIAKYEWDFDGDGIFEWSSTENGRELNIYNNEGTYTATLRVTDNDGFTATDTVVVIISEKTIQLDDDGNVVVEDADEDEEGIPGLGFAAAILSVGLIARARRD